MSPRLLFLSFNQIPELSHHLLITGESLIARRNLRVSDEILVPSQNNVNKFNEFWPHLRVRTPRGFIADGCRQQRHMERVRFAAAPSRNCLRSRRADLLRRKRTAHQSSEEGGKLFGGGKVNHPLLLPTPRGCGCFANEELNLASDVPLSRAACSEWLSSSLTSLCPAVDLPLSPRLRGERRNHGRMVLSQETDGSIRSQTVAASGIFTTASK
ncbi:uncharacterized [Tachysurus ichikawai]